MTSEQCVHSGPSAPVCSRLAVGQGHLSGSCHLWDRVVRLSRLSCRGKKTLAVRYRIRIRGFLGNFFTARAAGGIRKVNAVYTRLYRKPGAVVDGASRPAGAVPSFSPKPREPPHIHTRESELSRRRLLRGGAGIKRGKCAGGTHTPQVDPRANTALRASALFSFPERVFFILTQTNAT